MTSKEPVTPDQDERLLRWRVRRDHHDSGAGAPSSEGGELRALLELWPTAVSYAISYLFIAIVWVNHHHLLRFPDVATHRLIWGNFAHLFAVSLMPFATAWIASTRLGAVPVAFYAGDFFWSM